MALGTKPIIIFSIFYSIIHFITPIIKFNEGFFRYQSHYDILTLNFIALYTLTIYIIICLLLSTKRFNLSIKDIKLKEYGKDYCKIIGLVVFFMGLYFALKDIYVLKQVGVDSFLTDRHATAEIRGGGRVFTNLMMFAPVFYYASWLDDINKKMLKKIILVFMLFFSIYYFSLVSSRNSILVILLLMTTVHYTYTKNNVFDIKKKISIFLGGIFIFLAGYKITLDRYSVSDSDYFSERINNIPLYMLDGAFGNDEALLWMLENNHDLYLGLTYISGFLSFIPRFLWEDKPLGAGPILSNLVTPGSYILGGEGNTSLTTGLLTESVMNFGWGGVFIIIFFWMILLSIVYKVALMGNNRLFQVLSLIILVALCSMFLYYEFLGFIVHILVFLIPVIILFYFIKLIKVANK